MSVFRFSVGAFECYVALDSSMKFTARGLIADPGEAELAQQAAAWNHPVDRIPVDNKVLLVRTGELNVLIDAGYGTRIAPPLGHAVDNLATVGIGPSDIDLMVITHADFDHIAGILDADGSLEFSTARYVMWRGGWDYWASEQSAEEWPQDRVDFVRTTYAAIDDRLELVDGGTEFLPGFRLLPATGHRRHHSVVQIQSEGKRLLHLSDAVVHPLFMAVREWASTFDSFPEEAIQDKVRLLSWAAEHQALVFGAHFPFPGVGRVGKQGTTWAWHPIGGQDGG